MRTYSKGASAAWLLAVMAVSSLPGVSAQGEVIDEVVRAPRNELPLPEKVQERDQLTPSVTIREEGGLVIEEYRVAGQVKSVRVTNEKGLSYEYLDIDGDGRLERTDRSDGAVAPVFYTLYEWE